MAHDRSVHYAGPSGSRALCGYEHFRDGPNTRLPITCAACLEVYLYVHIWRVEKVPAEPARVAPRKPMGRPRKNVP